MSTEGLSPISGPRDRQDIGGVEPPPKEKLEPGKGDRRIEGLDPLARMSEAFKTLPDYVKNVKGVSSLNAPELEELKGAIKTFRRQSNVKFESAGVHKAVENIWESLQASLPSEVQLDPSFTIEESRVFVDRLEKFRSSLPIEDISSRLDEFGLTPDELRQIEQYYTSSLTQLEQLPEPTHIRKETISPGFPRSLVYIPKGPQKGLYVLLKSKGGIKQVGIGSFNRATLALHMDTGSKKVYRDAKATDIKSDEIYANEIVSKYPERFAAGVPVKYRGPWRSRAEEVEKIDKSVIPKEPDVEKVGFMMDFIEGGELFDRIESGDFPPQTPLELKNAIGLLAEYVEHLEVLHQNGLVHLDQKPENTFMTGDGHPRIADFGFTKKVGDPQCFCGTPGFIPPEMGDADLNGLQYYADTASDIWTFGCLMADLLEEESFYNWQIQTWGEFYEKELPDEATLDRAKNTIFANRRNRNHHDFLIDKCLQLNPTDRLTAHELVIKLREIYNALP